MELFLYMMIAVILGSCAIILVSGELSYISGISKSGRYILAFFLSFGVLGFSVKTLVIGVMQQDTIMEVAIEASQNTKHYDAMKMWNLVGLLTPIAEKLGELFLKDPLRLIRKK